MRGSSLVWVEMSRVVLQERNKAIAMLGVGDALDDTLRERVVRRPERKNRSLDRVTHGVSKIGACKKRARKRYC